MVAFPLVKTRFDMNISRKKFLQTIGLGTLVAPAVARDISRYPAEEKPLADPLNIGLASYTLRSLSLDDTIRVADRLGLHSIALKSMHLPLDSSDSEIKAVAKKVRDAGLDLYGAGVIYMKSENEVDQAFHYAKTAGMKVIIGVPNYELLPLVDKKVKETNIKLAIHNHGPGDDVYPSPDTVYDKVKDFDERIGLCMDIGHTFRIGQDPAGMARKYASRLYDIHLKDVNKQSGEGTPLEIGRGIMDIPAFLRAIQDIGYDGVVAIEYEKDGDDPVPGLAESVGYIRGVLDMMPA